MIHSVSFGWKSTCVLTSVYVFLGVTRLLDLNSLNYSGTVYTFLCDVSYTHVA